MHNSNRARIFADVVSVDAWHSSFGADCALADLHADVVFQTARVGGESASPVRFRLALRRAEVVVVIPETETSVRVQPDSVARDATVAEIRETTTIERRLDSAAEAGGQLSIKPDGLTAGFDLGASGATASSAVSTRESSRQVKLVMVTQSKTPEGLYRWTMESGDGPHLEGRGWDAAASPRLKLRDLRQDRSRGIPPTIQVEVRCKREDMMITDLEVKDSDAWERLKRLAGFDKRLAAAECYIRSRLAEEGLSFGDLSDPYGDVTLANVIADAV
ncbi:MAG: hypothetical protein AAF899_03015 [Pseudomonadota bacterium]